MAKENPITQNGGASEAEQAKARKSRVAQADVPRYSLRDALRVPEAISENYAKAPTKPLQLAIALELSPSSSHFRMLCGASSAYGLTDGSHSSDVISLTPLGRRIVAPTEVGSSEAALREALLKPRVIREFLTRYNNERIPPEKIACNVLEEMLVPSDSTKATLQLILQGAREVGVLTEHKGQLYVDLDAVQPSGIDKPEEISEEVPNDDGTGDDASREDLAASISQPHRSSVAVTNNRVFITHGKNIQIVNQLKELLAFGNFIPVVAAETETVSKPVPLKVMDEMRSCYAAIIHVGKEIKLLDAEGKEHFFVNQNVLIEIGAAMALYNHRFILLVEQGATLPSNLQGLYEVRYVGDKLDYDATMKLLRAFNEFKS
jgi:predicted nucleotide-binding protein